jgi:hypothetical protein
MPEIIADYVLTFANGAQSSVASTTMSIVLPAPTLV